MAGGFDCYFTNGLILLYAIIPDSELLLEPSGYVTSSGKAGLARCAANDESSFDERVRFCHNPAPHAASGRWPSESAEA